MRKIDLTGQSFGRLTVIDQAEHYISPTGKKQIRWNCLCDCGNKAVVATNQLRSGGTVSCGCYHKEQQEANLILQPKDISGQKFGTLTAIRVVGSDSKNRALWECVCECGAVVVKIGAELRSGHIKSCGDRSRHAIKHGGYKDRLFKVYTAIKQRCCNPNYFQYKDYGGRGITICNEWLNDYGAFQEWAYKNGYTQEILPNGLNKWTIDRINNNKGYSPDNCRWITTQEQQFNKRDNVVLTFNGETMTATEWAHKLNLSPYIIWARLKSGWSVEETLKTPKLNNRFEREKSVANA